MAPPPKPPIICYDLQTNSNARRAPDPRYRVPLTGTVRKTKVTLVQRDPNELRNARADACWHQQQDSYDYYHDHLEQRENSENISTYHRPTIKIKTKATAPTAQATRPMDSSRSSHTPHDKVVRVTRPYNNKTLLESRPYKFTAQPFGTTNQSTLSSKLNVANARHAYGQQLRNETEMRKQRSEHVRYHLSWQAQLDEITAQIESAKRLRDNLLKTFGMSHNAAKYIQQQDEDFAKLKKKVDQFAETRTKELGRRVQQMKRFQEIQKKEDRRVEEIRLRGNNTPISTHCKHRWNSTLNNSLSSNSPTTNTVTTNTTNTASPSSTISISPCSSSMSIDEQHLTSIHFADPPSYKSTTTTRQPTLPTSTILSSSTPTKSQIKRTASIQPSPIRPNDKFSFYKGNPVEDDETIEVTDVDFFDKVEDKTMLEVNELLNKMQSVLRDFGQEMQ